MFCPKCGANIAENSAFCPGCGSPVASAVAAAPTFNPSAPSIDQPTYNPAAAVSAPPRYYGASAKSRGLTRNQYLKTEAPENIKKLGKNSVWFFALSAVLVALCLFNALSTAFYDIPIYDAIFNSSIGRRLGDEIEYEFNSLDDDIDRAYSSLETDYNRDLITQYEYEKGMELLDDAREFTETPSLINFSSCVNKAEEVSTSTTGFFSLNSEFSIVIDLTNLAIIAAYVVAIMVIGFAFLATYLKSTVAASFATVFAAIVTLAFASIGLALLCIAANAILIFVCAKINAAYKAA